MDIVLTDINWQYIFGIFINTDQQIAKLKNGPKQQPNPEANLNSNKKNC